MQFKSMLIWLTAFVSGENLDTLLGHAVEVLFLFPCVHGKNASAHYTHCIERGNVIKLLCSFCKLVCEIAGMCVPVATPKGNPVCKLLASGWGWSRSWARSSGVSGAVPVHKSTPFNTPSRQRQCLSNKISLFPFSLEFFFFYQGQN